MKDKYFLAVIFLAIILFFAPFLANPGKLTQKDNDLGRNYIPVISFIKDSFHTYNQIPLWRPTQMMGETFTGNPVSSIFYPANIFFLILKEEYSAVFYLLVHFLLAGLSTFYLARSFNLSQQSSAAAAIFYALSFKMLVHLEAGHMTMIAAFSYFPLSFLAVRNLLLRPAFKWIVAGSFSLVFMFFTYPTVFYYATIFLAIYWIYIQLGTRMSFDSKAIQRQLPFVVLFAAAMGLSSIALFPQLEFAPLSTRSTLILEDVAIPIWNIKMFLESLIFPYKALTTFNHEAFLYLGLVPSILATIGFIKLTQKQKLVFLIFVFISLLFAAGLSAPLFAKAYDYVPFLKYSRVTTRFWFIFALLAALLSAYALDKVKQKAIIVTVVIFFLAEAAFVFGKRNEKIPTLNFENESLYQFFQKDPEIFRVYCTTHCLNPQLVSKYNLQILDGENPIQDANFIKFLEKAGNYSFGKFAVIFPPYQVWQVQSPPVPDSKVLASINVKYIASSYKLPTDKYDFINQFGNISLYKNKTYQKRAFFDNDNSEVDITYYSPNRIILKFKPEPVIRKLIISDNYFPGWVAFIDHEKHQVLPADNQSRLVVVPQNASEVELKFKPKSLEFGKTITLTTLVVMAMYFWYIRSKNTV